MKINIKTNNKEFAKKMTNLQKKQIPFASSQAINETLVGLKKEMFKQTEKKLDRPTRTTQNGCFVKRSNKKNLTGVLGIKDFVAKYLHYQIEGGVRSTGKKIPVPYKPNARLNKFGNIPSKRRGLIKRPNKQFIAKINGVSGVYEKFGKGGSQVKLLIAFEDTVTYDKKIFPFYQIANGYINNTYNRKLQKALTRAMKTAR